jgi:hypothetical protein
MFHIEKAERNGRYVLIIKPKTWEEYYTAEELAKCGRLGSWMKLKPS